MPQLPIYVISLARAPERRRSVCAHLDGLGLQYTLIDAVDGRTLPESVSRAQVADGCQLAPAEIGCMLSHLIAWRSIAEGPAPAGVILEDDARLDRRFVPVLRRGLASYDFDYLFLDVAGHNRRGLVAYDPRSTVKVGGPFKAYLLSAGGEGTHALMVTREAAALRAKHALPMRAPADVYDVLPYPIRFRALVGARAAYLGLSSLHSYVSNRDAAPGAVKLKWLRRFSWFYDVRELVSPTSARRRVEVRRMARAGVLPPGQTWRALPPGRNLIPS